MTAAALMDDQERRDRAEAYARGIIQRHIHTKRWQPQPPTNYTGPQWMRLLAKRLKWDAVAAHERSDPILQDAWEIEQVAPELGPDAWHLAAGAACLCACMSPAAHRDGLEQLAERLLALAESCAACTAEPGGPCRPWCLARDT